MSETAGLKDSEEKVVAGTASPQPSPESREAKERVIQGAEVVTLSVADGETVRIVGNCDVCNIALAPTGRIIFEGKMSVANIKGQGQYEFKKKPEVINVNAPWMFTEKAQAMFSEKTSAGQPSTAKALDVAGAESDPREKEFYSFEDTMQQLNIDEPRLKRLVEEGEIRAYRKGEAMRFKRREINNLAGRDSDYDPADENPTENGESAQSEASPEVARATDAIVGVLEGAGVDRPDIVESAREYLDKHPEVAPSLADAVAGMSEGREGFTAGPARLAEAIGRPSSETSLKSKERASALVWLGGLLSKVFKRSPRAERLGMSSGAGNTEAPAASPVVSTEPITEPTEVGPTVASSNVSASSEALPDDFFDQDAGEEVRAKATMVADQAVAAAANASGNQVESVGLTAEAALNLQRRGVEIDGEGKQYWGAQIAQKAREKLAGLIQAADKSWDVDELNRAHAYFEKLNQEDQKVPEGREVLKDFKYEGKAMTPSEISGRLDTMIEQAVQVDLDKRLGKVFSAGDEKLKQDEGRVGYNALARILTPYLKMEAIGSRKGAEVKGFFSGLFEERLKQLKKSKGDHVKMVLLKNFMRRNGFQYE